VSVFLWIVGIGQVFTAGLIGFVEHDYAKATFHLVLGLWLMDVSRPDRAARKVTP